MEDNAGTGHPSTTIGNTLTAIVSTLLDEDRWITVWEMEWVFGILKTVIHHILTKYLMKKKVAVWWIPHMLFPHTKTTSYGIVWETFDSLQKWRNCVFATNNHYRWKLGWVTSNLNWSLRVRLGRKKIHPGCKNSDAKLWR